MAARTIHEHAILSVHHASSIKLRPRFASQRRYIEADFNPRRVRRGGRHIESEAVAVDRESTGKAAGRSRRDWDDGRRAADADVREAESHRSVLYRTARTTRC